MPLRPCLLAVLPVLLGLGSPPAGAGACRLEPSSIARGETRDLLLCGSDLARGARLGGLDAYGLEVVYQQPVRLCEPGSREPGLHLVVEARAQARTAMLDVFGADGRPACDVPPELAVAPRLLLGTIVLAAQRGEPGRARLEIAAPPGVDFSAACASNWVFDAGDGPSLALAGPPRCRARRLGALLDVGGEQLGPARLLLRVREGGAETDAVALIRRPQPAWLGAMPPERARYVDVAGIRTRYFEAGRGPALVLVHGGQAGGENNHAEVWQQNLPGLARHFRVIAVDRLGQAGTGNPGDPADYARFYERDAEHLYQFIRALGLRDVALVGHSQGGYPVTAVALDHPDLVRCLVNVDSVMVPEDAAAMQRALGFIAYIATALHPPEGPTFYSARRGLGLRGPSGHNITDEEARRVVDQYRDPKTREAREKMTAARMTPLSPVFKSLREAAFARIRAGDLAVPSLVIWGADDPQVPLELGLRFYEILRGGPAQSALHVIDHAGHFPFVEHPDAFNRVVTAFCGR